MGGFDLPSGEVGADRIHILGSLGEYRILSVLLLVWTGGGGIVMMVGGIIRSYAGLSSLLKDEEGGCYL
ncbi:hypothetical protein ASPFODRAFT_689660 [Aspergillus luchuensis CBS 106.47]|uniref:Uncharacterized protein n=1 Tax=Aspergillus luchuensis (strain CBS 106.47) TaxID=1137211 RepID=A0A1M3TD60_ASPLC|nr:hypothetical protein ASPFODRAFT_689660 [Aspergillus luchuensis CBS 106.47]